MQRIGPAGARLRLGCGGVPGKSARGSLLSCSVSFRRLGWFVACLLGLLVATACEVSVDVDIDVEDDASGIVGVTVSLDEEAVARGPDDLAATLRTQDLIDNGWTFDGFEEDDDGGVVIAASKAFGDEDQLQRVLDEITGRGGIFQNFRINRTSEFATRTYELTGRIDLSGGIELFNDAETTALLGGNPLGRPLEGYTRSQSLAESVPLQVDVSLPGEGEQGSRSEATYQPRFDDEGPTRVSLATVQDNFLARLLRWIGMAALALFALALLLGILGMYLDYRARKRGPGPPTPLATRVPAAPQAAAPFRGQPVAPRPAPAPVAAAPAAGPAPGASRSQLRQVILDPLGVLYDLPDDPASLAVATARRFGSSADYDVIIANHRDLILGRMSTADFWHECGVTEDAATVDQDHLAQFRPRTGAADFLREMSRRQMPVAALTNDAVEWSLALQERDNLSMVAPWMVSGQVGAVKPDPGLYEAMRRTLGTSYEGCLCIDSVADHLDAAVTLGMQAAYMTSGRASEKRRPNHPVVASFSDFFRRR